MLEVTTNGSVLMAALPRWSAKRLSAHQSSSASAGAYGDLSCIWRSRCDSPLGSNVESLSATQSSQGTRARSVSSA